MAEMPATARAAHFGADHAVAGVDMLVDQRLVGGRGEAGPAAAGIMFGATAEQLGAAAGADIFAGLLVVPVGAGEGALGARLAQHMILLGIEPLAPLVVAEVDFFHGAKDGSAPASRQSTRVMRPANPASPGSTRVAAISARAPVGRSASRHSDPATAMGTRSRRASAGWNRSAGSPLAMAPAAAIPLAMAM